MEERAPVRKETLLPVIVLFLCHERDFTRERKGYADAFRKAGHDVACVPDRFGSDTPLEDILRALPSEPGLIIEPDLESPLLPWDLAARPIPTACFEIDTMTGTANRAHWACLHDIPCLFVPGHEDTFRAAGHPSPLRLPYAVEAGAFPLTEEERIFDVGWVGRTDGVIYHARRRILPQLEASFKLNDWRKSYPRDEMARILRQSRIVVNIQRDDHWNGAGLRPFEGMASGAMVMTSVPSELEMVGLRDGVHFVGYRSESDIVPLVRKYLENPPAREAIARAGRETVLRDHTYDARVGTLLAHLESIKGGLPSPARKWSPAERRCLYVHFFARHRQFARAWSHLRAAAAESLPAALSALPNFAGCYLRHLQQSIGRRRTP